jgi:sulfite dehydrogenase
MRRRLRENAMRAVAGTLWLAAGIAPMSAWADDAADLALGKRLFSDGAQPACAGCHMLKDAGSQGEIGPALDELRPDAARVATAMRNGIGAMPSFKGQLTEAEIQAVSKYVSTVAGR